MAYICYKPKGSCKTCPHFRFDEDKQRLCCFALFDRQHTAKAAQGCKRGKEPSNV